MLSDTVLFLSCLVCAGADPGCSSPCLNGGTCLRSLGECVCVEGWAGPHCESRETICPPGFYGISCQKACGQCADDSACHWVTGNCTGGCEEGYYGWRCDQPCGECRGGAGCERSVGRCAQGCEVSYHGTSCDRRCRCSEGRPCHQDTGECSACDEGFYGLVCKRRCGHCRSLSKCNPRSGVCETGCQDGFSPPYCKRQAVFTRPQQATATSPWWKTPHIVIPISTVYGFFALIFLCCCVSRMCKNRNRLRQCLDNSLPLSAQRAARLPPNERTPVPDSTASCRGVLRPVAFVKRVRDLVATRRPPTNLSTEDAMVMQEGRLNRVCASSLPLDSLLQTPMMQNCMAADRCSSHVTGHERDIASSSARSPTSFLAADWVDMRAERSRSTSRPRLLSPVPDVFRHEVVSPAGAPQALHANPAFDSGTELPIYGTDRQRVVGQTEDPPPPYELVVGLSSSRLKFPQQDPFLC